MMFALRQRECLPAFHALTSIAIVEPTAFTCSVRLDLEDGGRHDRSLSDERCESYLQNLIFACNFLESGFQIGDFSTQLIVLSD